jgi:Glucose-6-phosphate dehydrogenase, C-terminal domain
MAQPDELNWIQNSLTGDTEALMQETFLRAFRQLDSFRAHQVEAAWELLMPVFEAWQTTAPSDFSNYTAGSWDRKMHNGCSLPDIFGRCRPNWRLLARRRKKFATRRDLK